MKMLEDFYAELRIRLIKFWIEKLNENVNQPKVDQKSTESIIEFSENMILMLKESLNVEEAQTELRNRLPF